MSHVVVVHPNTGYKTTYPADLLNELGTKNNTCETSVPQVLHVGVQTNTRTRNGTKCLFII